jgi:hypothetical protein
MADKVRELTDKKLVDMEKHLSAIYTDAQKDIQKKADEYFKAFEKADAEKLKLVKQGKLSEKEYKQWRQGKLMYGKRYTALKEDISKQLLNVNQTAVAYVNGELPEIYSMNYNALADVVDGVGGYSFTLTDPNTVKTLALADKSLLPYKKLNPTKDIAWNMRSINSQVLQGIIQGESIPKISKRMMNVENMNKTQAVRTARTLVTSAENKGRLDSFYKAEQDGINLEKFWVATAGERTRTWHAQAGAMYSRENSIPIDEPFNIDGEQLMCPGDASLGASGRNLYNCRCAMGSKVIGFRKMNK